MKRPIQTVYVLRFWAEHSPRLPHETWRFVLQDPQSGERIGFTTLSALTEHLAQQMSPPSKSE
ncbi:MAG: hypothetical protein AAF614_36385 [Chloroflexota bacterium]